MNRLLLGETGIGGGSAVKRETGASRGGGAVRREISASSSGTVKKKTTQGRKKIEIKMIENDNNRQVTFSKRRTGLFKKASELCILCGVEVAIVVLSPGKRIFTFGHTSTDSVVDRFLSGDAEAGQEEGEEVQSSNAAKQKEVEEYNLHYSKVSKEVEVEKKRRRENEEKKKSGVYNGAGEDYWWNQPVDGLGLEELKEYLTALEELANKVAIKAGESRSLKSLPMLPAPPVVLETVGNQDVAGPSGSLNDASWLLNVNPLNSGFDYENNCPFPSSTDRFEGH